MAKDMMEEMKERGKKDKESPKEDMSKPIKHIHASKMDDGSWTVKAESDHMNLGQNSYQSAHPDAHSAMKMIHNHMTTPHLPKLGSGKRFDMLSSKLSQQPGVRNPDALAAFLGRKKYGAVKFNALSQK